MRLSTPLIPTSRRILTALVIAGVVAIEAQAQEPDQGEPAQEPCAVLEAAIQSAASGFEGYRAGIGHARDTRQGPAQDSVSLVVTFGRQTALAT